jgi:hypothetical protein
MLDPTFDPGAGGDALVRAIAVQPNGQIIVAGDFETFGGLPRRFITRLNGTPRLAHSHRVRDEFVIQVHTARNRDYALESTDSIATANWSQLSIARGDGTVTILRDTNVPQQRFYRVRVSYAASPQ